MTNDNIVRDIVYGATRQYIRQLCPVAPGTQVQFRPKDGTPFRVDVLALALVDEQIYDPETGWRNVNEASGSIIYPITCAEYLDIDREDIDGIATREQWEVWDAEEGKSPADQKN